MSHVGLLPLWLEAFIALLVLAGAGLALLGAIGLLSLRSFFECMHAPALISTLACWLIMHATVIYFSVVDGGLALHALLIAVFVAVTAPVTSIFLLRAALFRARRSGEDVPPSLSLSLNSPSPADASAEAVQTIEASGPSAASATSAASAASGKVETSPVSQKT